MEVATPCNAAPPGMLSPYQSTSRGTSRWQCGHQWATKTSSVGPFPTETAAPAKSVPATTGACMPTAGSSSGSSNGGSAVPVTRTVPVSDDVDPSAAVDGGAGDDVASSSPP